MRLLTISLAAGAATVASLLPVFPAHATAGRAPAPQVRAVRSLQQTLRADLRDAGGTGSALVVDSSTGRTLFAAAPHAWRLPASIEKLYTTSTALLKFGPNARFSTTVQGVGTRDASGVWHGTLYLRGGGDPTFGDAAFDRAAYGTGATVQRLVANVRRAGITGVRGRIVGDESYFDSLRGTVATGYHSDLEYEGELSALSFDAGFTSPYETALQTRPALFATEAFVAALRSAHIRVPQRTPVYTGRTPQGAKLLATVRSPNLATLLRLTNAPSDNFFAETLLKDIGARFGAGGTTAAGVAVVRQFVAQRFGLGPVIVDGSGLAREDHTSVSQVVALLRAMASNPTFQRSLAVAGVSGTMRYEMVGTRGVGNCHGKTGTLIDVANLAGYCTAANGDTLVFAILMNGIPNTYTGHALEDRMGEAIATYNPATGQG